MARTPAFRQRAFSSTVPLRPCGQRGSASASPRAALGIRVPVEDANRTGLNHSAS